MKNKGASVVRIVAGDKVLMEFSTFGDRFLSVVTDVKDDGRLLVFSPISAPVVERLSTDTTAKVRFAHEGRLHGFKTRVLNRVDGPGGVLELAAPGGFYDAEDRCEPRCPVRFPAVIEHGGKSLTAVVEDMSATCSRVRFVNGGFASLGESEGGEVRLIFHPFDMGEGYSVNCIVRNTFIRDDAPYAVLSFKSDETEARHKIEQFIEAQLFCGIPRL